MSKAPAELWLRPWAAGWYETQFREEPAAVRYIRADLHDELVALMALLQQEPVGTDYR